MLDEVVSDCIVEMQATDFMRVEASGTVVLSRWGRASAISAGSLAAEAAVE